eukprot:m.210387 g.210387  ORF g.210387 m.210387 type:complete len:593 (-) comp17818_c1_seq2:5503-7281(-)
MLCNLSFSTHTQNTFHKTHQPPNRSAVLVFVDALQLRRQRVPDALQGECGSLAKGYQRLEARARNGRQHAQHRREPARPIRRVAGEGDALIGGAEAVEQDVARLHEAGRGARRLQRQAAALLHAHRRRAANEALRRLQGDLQQNGHRRAHIAQLHRSRMRPPGEAVPNAPGDPGVLADGLLDDADAGVDDTAHRADDRGTADDAEQILHLALVPPGAGEGAAESREAAHALDRDLLHADHRAAERDKAHGRKDVTAKELAEVDVLGQQVDREHHRLDNAHLEERVVLLAHRREDRPPSLVLPVGHNGRSIGAKERRKAHRVLVQVDLQRQQLQLHDALLRLHRVAAAAATARRRRRPHKDHVKLHHARVHFARIQLRPEVRQQLVHLRQEDAVQNLQLLHRHIQPRRVHLLRRKRLKDQPHLLQAHLNPLLRPRHRPAPCMSRTCCSRTSRTGGTCSTCAFVVAISIIGRSAAVRRRRRFHGWRLLRPVQPAKELDQHVGVAHHNALHRRREHLQRAQLVLLVVGRWHKVVVHQVDGLQHARHPLGPEVVRVLGVQRLVQRFLHLLQDFGVRSPSPATLLRRRPVGPRRRRR